MTNYIIFRLTDAFQHNISFDGTLNLLGVYKFNELGCDCYGISEVGGSGSTVVTIRSSYTSGNLTENGNSCLADTSPCVDFEKDLITEDDVNLHMYKKMNINEVITNIKTSAIISNGIDTYTLSYYNIPLPNNYIGGYLDYSAVIDMDWINFFPSGSINNRAIVNTTGDNIEVLLPNLINWRYFQSLPQLTSIFGVDATNNWRWYYANGWNMFQRVEVETPDGNYINDYSFAIRDYDDNDKINWTWEFYKLSDNTQLTVPISGELVKVVVTGDMPLNTTIDIDYATVTIENVEDSNRFLISSFYNQTGQTQSPLLPFDVNTKLDLNNITGVNKSFELTFVLDPSKLTNGNNIKLTARCFESTGEYTERSKKEFPLPSLPAPKLGNEFKDDCCDCLPELKLASYLQEDIVYNDITGVAHKRQSDLDTCEFKIYKDNNLLANNGIDFLSGFPNDANVSAFVYNWKYYLVNHGIGCYTIKKVYTVAGIEITEDIGIYDLDEYTPENAESTVRVLYQNNFETLYNESIINYADSGFEDSYRFRGMFGQWQPNVFSESNFTVRNENRVTSIKSKDTYILNHFHATECHIDRLHKIVLSASVWRISDHNRNNTLQALKIYDCVLDNDNREEIKYNTGSKVTGIEVILSRRQQNSVSLFDGSIQLVQGVTWHFPTVTGEVVCKKSKVINSNGSYDIDVNSGSTLSLPNINFTDSNGVVSNIPSMEDIVANQCVLQVFGADTITTGQTTSYRTGDDGDLQRGRAVNFFIMGYNNGFGNTNRFTDELGGQIYLNSIIIDWSTWNGGANVKAFSLSLNSNISGTQNWNQWIDGQPYSVNSVNNWYVANIQELDSVINWSFISGLSYLPFNAPATSGNGLHCSTTPPNSTYNALIKSASLPYLSIFPKTTLSRSLLIRMYTLTELGL